MIVKPFVLAFIATAGFAVLFNIERKKAVVASFGGSLAWVVYETLNTLTRGRPVIPVCRQHCHRHIFRDHGQENEVPGNHFLHSRVYYAGARAYVYYTMLEAAEQNYGGALDMFLITLLKSAAISLGLIIASAIVAVTLSIKRIRQNTRRKELKNN